MATYPVEDFEGFSVCYPDDLFGERYQAREARGESFLRCIICGKDTSRQGGSMGVFISGGGGTVIRPQDYDSFPHRGGDMGWFPVGTECIKRIPVEFHTPNPYDDKVRGV